MAQDRERITKHPEVRREELLQAALELFHDAGYEKTSVQMITERVGVAKGLFYHYFSSKADLLNQLAGWQAELFIATLPRHASEMEGDGLRKLRELSGRISQWKFDDLRELTRAYLEVMYRPENAALRTALFAETAARLTPIYAEIIAEMAEQGLAAVEDPRMTAELLFNLGTAMSERNAGLILGLPEHPANLEELLARLRAWQDAMERLLGMKPGTLQLYDFDYIRAALRDLLEEERAAGDGQDARPQDRAATAKGRP